MGARRITSALASSLLLFGLAGCETHKKDKPGSHESNVAASSTQRAQTPPAKPPSNSKARIEFAELEHDLGTVNDTEPLSYNFKFKNVGTETLVIEKVGSS